MKKKYNMATIWNWGKILKRRITIGAEISIYEIDLVYKMKFLVLVITIITNKKNQIKQEIMYKKQEYI